MNFIQKLLKNMKDSVIGFDPYEEVSESFTAEVNQDLLQQIKNKDTEIEELKEIITQICYRNMLAINEALSHFDGFDDDGYYEEYEDDDSEEQDTETISDSGGYIVGL